jgi:hypothetical protein
LILGDIPHGLGRIAKWFHQASAAFEPPPADSRYWVSRAPWSTGQQVEERRFNAKDPPKKIPKVVPIHWGLYLFNMFLTFKVSNVSCGYCYLNLCSSKSGSTKGSPGGILSAHWSASLKQWLSDNCLEIVDPHWSTGYCGLVHAILFTRLTWVCPLLWMEEILHHLGWLKPYK